MKVFLEIIWGLFLIVLTDLYFDYIVSRDIAPTIIVFLGGVVVLALWIMFIYRIIKDLINYFNKQKTKEDDN